MTWCGNQVIFEGLDGTVILAQKLTGQQALQALMLLFGSTCVLPSSLLQLTCVAHLLLLLGRLLCPT